MNIKIIMDCFNVCYCYSMLFVPKCAEFLVILQLESLKLTCFLPEKLHVILHDELEFVTFYSKCSDKNFYDVTSGEMRSNSINHNYLHRIVVSRFDHENNWIKLIACQQPFALVHSSRVYIDDF